MIGGLASLLLAWSASSVTLTEPAAGLSDVLSALSDRAGVPISATGDLGNEVVALRIRERPLEEALAWLAKAVEGRVVRERKGYRLDPDLERRRFREDEGGRRFTDRIRTRLEVLAKATGANQPLDREAALRLIRDRRAAAKDVTGTADEVRWRRREETEYRRPTGRAILGALRASDLSGLAELLPGEAILYSTNPSRYCRPMGKAGRALLDRFTEEWNALSAAAVGDPNPEDWIGDSLWPIDATFQNPVEELRLVVTRPDADRLVTNLWIRVSGYGLGPAGSLVLDARSSEPKEATPTDWRVGEVLRPEDLDATWARAVMNPDSAETARAGLIEWMSRVPLREPWRLLTGPLVRHAERAQLEFVACLDDRAFGSVRRGLAEGSAKAYDEAFAERHTFERSGGRWTIKPREPWEARRSRVLRRVLANFVTALLQKGFASVWDRAPLYASPLGSGLDSIPAAYERLLGVSISGTHPSLALGRLLGLLPDSTRRALLRGEIVEVQPGSSLPTDRLAAVALEGMLARPTMDSGGGRAYRVDPRDGDPAAALERAGGPLTLRLAPDESFDWLRVQGKAVRNGERFGVAAARTDALLPPAAEGSPSARYYEVKGRTAFIEVWVGDRCTYGPTLLVEGDLRGAGRSLRGAARRP